MMNRSAERPSLSYPLRFLKSVGDAQAMKTRQGQDPSGLGLSPCSDDSAVPAAKRRHWPLLFAACGQTQPKSSSSRGFATTSASISRSVTYYLGNAFVRV